MHLQESGEMYLETILILSQKSPYVRAIDVGEYMGFSKPSVSRAIGLLKNGGYITADGEGHLFLTDEGKYLAGKREGRHLVLTRCLVALGVNEETADADACKIEHHLSDETFAAIKRHAEKALGIKW